MLQKLEIQILKLTNIINEENKARIEEKLQEILDFEIAMLDKTEKTEEECLNDCYQKCPSDFVNDR